MINVWDKRLPVRLEVSFVDLDGLPVDPDTVAVEVLKPSGSRVTYTFQEVPEVVFRTAVGEYHAIVEIDEAGDWHYDWVSTGVGQAAKRGQFSVEPIPF